MACSKAAPPLLCILALLCLSTGSASDTTEPDYNILTLMWPGSGCISGPRQPPCCCPLAIQQPELGFFVEALETYSSITGKPVTNCEPKCRFNINEVAAVIEDLNSYWPDVSCPSENGFDKWQSVWCTYGNCSGLRELDYFNRTLTLRKYYDLQFILGEFGIVPSDTTTYKLEAIKEALRPSLGVSSFYLGCKNTLLGGVPELYKIHICVSADGKELISCPNSPPPETVICKADVRFPVFTRELLTCAGPIMNPIKMPTAV